MAISFDTERQPKKRRPLIWGTVLILALAFAWRVVSNFGSYRSPFSEKDKVLASLPWVASHGKADFSDERHYDWLDNETLVYFLPNGHGKYQAIRQRVRNNQISPAKPLTNITLPAKPDDLSVSPDGRWLLAAVLGPNWNPIYSVYSLDNGGIKRTITLTPYGVTWMSDGKNFISQTEYAGEAYQYGTEGSRKKRLVFPQTNQNYFVLTSKGDYFASEHTPQGNPVISVECGSIFGGKSQIRKLPSPSPAHDFALHSVSPQGHRLLWSCGGMETSWFSRFLSRIMRTRQGQTNRQIWYVTDTQGGSVQKVADVAASNSLFPKWLPDGKHLSIVYHGVLYVVPVP